MGLQRLLLNVTMNESDFADKAVGFGIDGPVFISTEHLVAVSLTLGLITVLTLLGNAFVIAAVLLTKNLRKASNYMIVSLAVSDLMVACFVMPIGVVNEVGLFVTSFCCFHKSSQNLFCYFRFIFKLAPPNFRKHHIVDR